MRRSKTNSAFSVEQFTDFHNWLWSNHRILSTILLFLTFSRNQYCGATKWVLFIKNIFIKSRLDFVMWGVSFEKKHNQGRGVGVSKAGFLSIGFGMIFSSITSFRDPKMNHFLDLLLRIKCAKQRTAWVGNPILRVGWKRKLIGTREGWSDVSMIGYVSFSGTVVSHNFSWCRWVLRILQHYFANIPDSESCEIPTNCMTT